MDAMKMQTTVYAPVGGKVAQKLAWPPCFWAASCGTGLCAAPAM
jgi:hypothetical protein